MEIYNSIPTNAAEVALNHSSWTPADGILSFMPFILGSTLRGCENVDSGSKFFGIEETGFLASLTLLSIAASLIVACTIFYNEKLSLHPSKLIGYMCLCEATQCFAALIWLIDPRQYSCYFGFHYLFHWLTFNM